MLKEATESSSFARYITQERVKELISYNPLTGEFTQNTMNSSLRSDNALGIKGVCYRGGAKPRYIAQIYKMGINYNRSFSIGKYGRAEALRLATEWSRSKREEIHGEFANHG